MAKRDNLILFQSTLFHYFRKERSNYEGGVFVYDQNLRKSSVESDVVFVGVMKKRKERVFRVRRGRGNAFPLSTNILLTFHSKNILSFWCISTKLRRRQHNQTLVITPLHSNILLLSRALLQHQLINVIFPFHRRSLQQLQNIPSFLELDMLTKRICRDGSRL